MCPSSARAACCLLYQLYVVPDLWLSSWAVYVSILSLVSCHDPRTTCPVYYRHAAQSLSPNTQFLCECCVSKMYPSFPACCSQFIIIILFLDCCFAPPGCLPAQQSPTSLCEMHTSLCIEDQEMRQYNGEKVNTSLLFVILYTSKYDNTRREVAKRMHHTVDQYFLTLSPPALEVWLKSAH